MLSFFALSTEFRYALLTAVVMQMLVVCLTLVGAKPIAGTKKIMISENRQSLVQALIGLHLFAWLVATTFLEQYGVLFLLVPLALFQAWTHARLVYTHDRRAPRFCP